ncbi:MULTISPECIES: FAD:protein FMN transferase [Arthrobacter]|uniref:FAD:protein FMN transferase n=1 Tax=Arthrobacter bambusae TaxID=1338426 RepID=A0AAW8DIH2_9MICC|nr:FAD:protein FMN transferase [Arthrobacter bambusae]MDP9905024.1 thiamine biosynthesis lipoprotein [Arthrobacter bambusae]MDQ0129840.1 thiamine biosynthesis lipoprotein [Arthrobacter bambusae]MDQ0181220.1 thiamine biosynthesis lipoprotein [Arthrobacter bambusae]
MAHTGWSVFSFDGIGTTWEISTPEQLPEEVRAGLLGVVEDYDRSYSRFRDDSLVAPLAREPGTVTLPAGAGELERLFKKLYRLSDGTMTPLIGGSLEHLGYGADYALRPLGHPVPAPRWEDALVWNGTEISASVPVVLDIGAAGKGQLVDLLASVLRGAGTTEFLVDASGDMLHSGAEPLGVGLEHPYDPTQAIGVVELHDGALCASAANRRAWGDGLHHVLDGATGRPVETVVATWTMATTAMEADALATALFMVDPKVLEREFEFSWLMVYSDGHAAYSAGFEGTLFS